MHLIQVFLPLGDGEEFKQALRDVRGVLTDEFGGATAFTHAPVRGDWQEEEGKQVVQDELIIVETMVRDLDRAWWRALKTRLEARLQEQEILIRALPMEQI